MTSDAAAAPPRLVPPAAFASVMFASAALLFVVQPMFAKMALPLLGGSPGVWTVSLVFFQAALLAGYAYAHLLARLSRIRTQAIVHALVLAASAAALPLSVSDALGPPSPDAPTVWLFALMAVSVGAPFAALSATAPLLQAWYARGDRADAHDPYHLYVASNAGSLLALVAYPIAIEPFLRLGAQTTGWSVGFAATALALVAVGALSVGTDRGRPEAESGAAAAVAWTDRIAWTGFAAFASSLLIGATAHVSTDVAAAPFLWAPPLILYLLTFIVAFSKRPILPWGASSLAYAIVALLAAPMVALTYVPAGVAFGLSLVVVFLGALTCHHALAARRPPAARLTEFYFFLSLGGVVGGLFNALAAPVLFDSILEYPIAIALCLLAVKPPERDGPTLSWAVVGAILLIAAAPLGLVTYARETGMPLENAQLGYGIAFAAAASLFLRGRPVLFAACAGLMLSSAVLQNRTAADFRDRTFFGVLKVATDPIGQVRWLAHGTTLHGSQSLAPGDELRPVTYYAKEGPIGGAIVALQADRALDAVGIVGLGAGSLACYARPGEVWRFHEIDPAVARVASNPALFTFVPACAPDAEIVIGDARLTLQDAPAGFYDIIVLDAFSSDSVPAHLMTREAVRLYLSKLKPNGVLVFHISNRHMALKDVLTRVGAAEGAAMRFNGFDTDAVQEARQVNSADVLAMARTEAALAPLSEANGWFAVDVPPGRPWTDDYSNVVGAIIAKKLFGRE